MLHAIQMNGAFLYGHKLDPLDQPDVFRISNKLLIF